MADPRHSVHRMKVVLRHVDPPIWRRFEVPSDITLGRLHSILQTVMGWEARHPHLFTIDRADYADGRASVPFRPPPEDEEGARLAEVAPAGTRIRYDYDLSDYGWEHVVLVEQVVPRQQGISYPRCLEGRRACPPEESDGPWGYGELLGAIAFPRTLHDQLLRETIGDGYDPDAFDPEAVNALLAESP